MKKAACIMQQQQLQSGLKSANKSTNKQQRHRSKSKIQELLLLSQNITVSASASTRRLRHRRAVQHLLTCSWEAGLVLFPRAPSESCKRNVHVRIHVTDWRSLCHMAEAHRPHLRPHHCSSRTHRRGCQQPQVAFERKGNQKILVFSCNFGAIYSRRKDFAYEMSENSISHHPTVLHGVQLKLSNHNQVFTSYYSD